MALSVPTIFKVHSTTKENLVQGDKGSILMIEQWITLNDFFELPEFCLNISE